MKTLIVFWHGIGDCILATPALRRYAKDNPDKEVHMAVTKPVVSSRFFEGCPYVKGTVLIRNPWDIKGGYRRGKRVVRQEVRRIAEKEGFSKVLFVEQHWSHGIHKLERTARELGVELDDTSYDVFITEEQRRDAKRFLKKRGLSRFVFLHRRTDIPKKNLSLKEARRFIKKQWGAVPVVEPGKDYGFDKPAGFSFALLEQAMGVVVVDSLFMHAADALGKRIDYAYFNLRPHVVDEVCPLHVKANLVKGPRERDLVGSLVWLAKKAVIRALHPKRLV